MGYDPTFEALCRLDLDKANEFQILKCFIRNMPRESQESFKVYQASLFYWGINKKSDVTLLTQSLKILNQSGYLTEQNFWERISFVLRLNYRLIVDCEHLSFLKFSFN